MSLVTNYGQLKQWLRDRLMDAELGGNEDSFVFDGHTMLMAELSSLLDMTLETTLTLGATEGEYTIAIPAGLNEVVSFYLDDQNETRLEELTSRQIDTYRQSNILSQPMVYSREANAFEFAPFYGEHDAILVYKASFDFFTDDSSTNWLLTNRPAAYQQAALVYAAQFNDDAEIEAKAEKQANREIVSLIEWNRKRSRPHMGKLQPATRATP